MKLISNYYILSICLLVFCCNSDLYSQDSDGKSYYVNQYYGSESLVNEYLSKHIPVEIDTVLAVFIPPMGCPRCEGTINLFINKFEEFSSNGFSLCVVFGENNSELANYLSLRNYSSDVVIVDNTRKILNEFKFSSDNLSVPFFLKFCKSTGELLNYESSLGLDLSNKTVESFVNTNRKLLIDRVDNIVEDKINFTRLRNDIVCPTLPIDKRFRSPESVNIPVDLSSVYLSPNGEYLSLVGRIDNTVYLLQKGDDELSLIKTISPTIEEENMFIEESITDTIVLVLKRLGVLNTMYLHSIPDDFGNQYIAASLPNVFFEKTESVAYYNAPVIIKVDNNNHRTYTLFNAEDMGKDPDLVYLHKSFFVNHNKGEVEYFFPIHKGWPVCGTDSEMLQQDELNPFKPAFYNNIPLFAVFDDSGNEIRKQFSLGPFYSSQKVGYFYSNPMLKFYQDGLLFFDKYSGEICTYDYIGGVNKKYNVFENSNVQISESSNKVDQIKSIVDQLNELLVDAACVGDTLYGIIENSEFYYIVSIGDYGLHFLNMYKKSVDAKFERIYLLSNDDQLRVNVLISNQDGVRVIESVII